MKIIHCADIHLDSVLTANLDREKAKERKEELLHTFTDMVEYANINGVSAIIIAGDLFDKKNISVTARKCVYEAIASNKNMDFYYLLGNHDANSFIDNLEEKPENLKLFGDEWISYRLGSNICISGIEFNNTKSQNIYNSLVLNNDDINIVVLHGQESAYNSKDKTEVINLKELKGKSIDYLALGHIHSYKEAELDARGVYCYSGCLEGRGFDECGSRGFVMLDIDEEKKKIAREFIPFAKRTLYEVNVDVTGCENTLQAVEVAEDTLKDADINSKDLVKLVIKGEIEEEADISKEYIRQQFADRFYFLKVYVECRLKLDSKKYAMDKSLKGEFVRLIEEQDNLDDEQKNDILKCGLQLLSGRWRSEEWN